MSARTAWWTGSNRRWKIADTCSPRSAASALIRSASATLSANGFSTTTCLSAPSASSAWVAWPSLGVQMTMMSTSSLAYSSSRLTRSASGQPARAAPSGDDPVYARSSTRSRSSFSAEACWTPIMPIPSRPTRNRSPMVFLLKQLDS